jgi:hypothetical protein
MRLKILAAITLIGILVSPHTALSPFDSIAPDNFPLNKSALI